MIIFYPEYVRYTAHNLRLHSLLSRLALRRPALSVRHQQLLRPQTRLLLTKKQAALRRTHPPPVNLRPQAQPLQGKGADEGGFRGSAEEADGVGKGGGS